MKTQINAYLNFNGKCHEVMTFYHSCLGGELTLQRISESPMAAQMPSEAGSKILHGTLINDSIILLGSDMMGENLVNGNSVGLCLNCTSGDEIQTFFSKLSVGGKVITPLHQSFWGATYGELTDKYGTNWMLNYKKN